VKKPPFYLFQIYCSIFYISEKICRFKDAKYSGLSRQQSQISSLEDKITLDKPVRFTEAFVQYILLEVLNFTAQKKRLTCLLLFSSKAYR